MTRQLLIALGVAASSTIWSAEAAALKTRESSPEEEAAIQAFWADVLAAPGHTWRADIAIGWHSWERASGDTSTGTYRLRVGSRFGEWLGGEATVDLAFRDEPAGPLELQNTLAAPTLAFGLERWFGAFRLQAMPVTGLVWRTSSLADTGGAEYTGSQLDPMLGGRVGIGLTFNRSVFFGFDVDAWFYAGRIESQTLFSIGWAFAP